MTETSDVAFEVKQDEAFFVDTDNVVFLVDDTLFRVSRYPFITGSPIFATLLSLSCNTNSEEGHANANPVALQGVNADDFKSFLRVVHPLGTPPCKTPLLGVHEWASVLRLAKMWKFDRVVPIATSNLGKLLKTHRRSLDAISLGKEFGRKDWHSYGVKTLVSRDNSLTDKEAKAIGVVAAAEIFRARERNLQEEMENLSDAQSSNEVCECGSEMVCPRCGSL